MRLFRALILAFSTYTRIPVPQVKWDDDALRLAIAFLPAAGAFIGGAAWVWLHICIYFGISAALFAAVAVTLPILITGGIHMDGYCDTSDALASWQDSKRRLEILKDPHIGAFALIRTVTYVLLCHGLLCELYTRGRLAGLVLVYVLSRCLAAFSALTMPNARRDGMLAAFTTHTDRRTALVLLALSGAAAAAALLLTDLRGGAAALALCVPAAIWYRGMARRRFGGATGDTTGFYLQITELAMLAGLLLGGLL